MSRLPNISLRLHGGISAAECIELARAAETAEFAGIWFAENAFARGTLPAAAACAMATQRIAINAGVFNPFSRHPTMMAMEIGALDELSGGRATLSIGSCIASATEKLGMDPSKPVPGLRDTLTIVRSLLRSGEADHTGAAFSARKVKLDYTPREDIPIYLAGRGDLTTKLAGELADGLLVSNMVSISYAGRLAELMRESRRAAGRTGSGLAVQYMPCAVNGDAKSAVDAGKRAVAAMLPGFWTLGLKIASAKEALLSGTDIDEQQFASAAARLRSGENPCEVLDDRFTRAFALVGTPDECLGGAARYAEVGITELALTFAGSTAVKDIALVGEALKHA
jgi:5,10-methylenetetrahydromethanopterin reductase